MVLLLTQKIKYIDGFHYLLHQNDELFKTPIMKKCFSLSFKLSEFLASQVQLLYFSTINEVFYLREMTILWHLRMAIAKSFNMNQVYCRSEFERRSLIENFGSVLTVLYCLRCECQCVFFEAGIGMISYPNFK